MKALYGRDNPVLLSDVIEGRLIQVGMRALELGTRVIIDFGPWSRNERSALRQAAADLSATRRLGSRAGTSGSHIAGRQPCRDRRVRRPQPADPSTTIARHTTAPSSFPALVAPACV